MQLPKRPPGIDALFARVAKDHPDRVAELLGSRSDPAPDGRYLHWDELRRRRPPDGLTLEEWWLRIKVARLTSMRELPFSDSAGKPFAYGIPDLVFEAISTTDREASGRLEIGGQVTNPSTRDRYVVRSLMEEAITSSLLEGAAVTRVDAKKLLRSGRRPRDKGERMVVNNFRAMQQIRLWQGDPITPERVCELHEIVTEGTLEHGEPGQLRTSDDVTVKSRDDETVLHVPPPAAQLEARLELACAFARGEVSETFVHPVVRAIVLHFILAYDHPFPDGNGRTARAAFYWSMLSQGYWLFEFLSISRILAAAPAQYARAFLHTETDGNDVTYFLDHQLGVIRQAVRDLHAYLEAKVRTVRGAERRLRELPGLNHRQIALLGHALRHPDAEYTIQAHRTSHGVVYQTARTDLLDLVDRGLLDKSRRGRSFILRPVADLGERF